MSPADQKRIEALRERLRHTKRGALPGAAACREIYRLVAPHLPADLAPLAGATLQIETDAASGVLAPPGLNVPAKWLRAVRAEAAAQVARGQSADGDYALSIRATADAAGVERVAARGWRASDEYRVAVARVVETLSGARRSTPSDDSDRSESRGDFDSARRRKKSAS